MLSVKSKSPGGFLLGRSIPLDHDRRNEPHLLLCSIGEILYVRWTVEYNNRPEKTGWGRIFKRGGRDSLLLIRYCLNGSFILDRSGTSRSTLEDRPCHDLGDGCKLPATCPEFSIRKDSCLSLVCPRQRVPRPPNNLPLIYHQRSDFTSYYFTQASRPPRQGRRSRNYCTSTQTVCNSKESHPGC